MLQDLRTVHAHVLAVDDDPAVRQLVVDYLAEFDIKVTAVATGREMLEAISLHRVDLVLLDLRLRGEDGLKLARDIRETSTLPIIILTGLNDEADRVMSLELGADDYLTKPFSPRELLARIRALLRRSRATRPATLALDDVRSYRFAGWELNLRLRRLTAPNGDHVPLSVREFNLLLAFASAPNQVLDRERLLDLTRHHSAEVFDRSIDTQVGRLRRKIEQADAGARIILTERGAGYRFAAEVEVLHV